MIVEFNSGRKRYKDFYGELERLENEIDAQIRARVRDVERKKIILDRMRNIADGYNDTKVYFRIVPDLCASFLKNHDPDILMYIGYLKVTLMKEDMNILNDEEIINYMEGLYSIYTINISMITDPSNIYNGYLSELERYMLIHFDYLITTYSRDVIVFFDNFIFDRPFKIKCNHCGDSSQELWLKEGFIKEIESIRRCVQNERLSWRMDMLVENNFQTQIRELWEMYGTFKCKSCGQENVPINAAALYMVDNEKWKLKVDDYLLNRLEKVLLGANEANTEDLCYRRVFYTNYLSGMYKELYGDNDIKCYKLLLSTSRKVRNTYGDEYLEYIIEDAKYGISKYSKQDIDLADVYMELAETLKLLNTRGDNKVVESINKYQTQAAQIYKMIKGEDSQEYINSNRSGNSSSRPRLDLNSLRGNLTNLVSNITNRNTGGNTNNVNTENNTSTNPVNSSSTNSANSTIGISRNNNSNNGTNGNSNIRTTNNNTSSTNISGNIINTRPGINSNPIGESANVVGVKTEQDYDKQHTEAMICEENGNYAKAAELEEDYISFLQRKYGMNADIVGDHRQELGNIYRKLGNKVKAKANLEVALKIHTRELNDVCEIPREILKEFVDIVYADINTERRYKDVINPCMSADNTVKVMSVADVLSDLGDFYLCFKEYVNALKYHRLGYELCSLAGFDNRVECGNKGLSMARVFLAVKDTKKAGPELAKAISVFEYCINHSEFDSEVEEAREGLDAARKLSM